jgi:hypothetical protein
MWINKLGYPLFKKGKVSTIGPKDLVFSSPSVFLTPPEESPYPWSSESQSRLLAQITFVLQTNWRNTSILDGSSQGASINIWCSDQVGVLLLQNGHLGPTNKPPSTNPSQNDQHVHMTFMKESSASRICDEGPAYQVA